jgi:inosine-uridine nucleoside N-ribohydrolase
VTDVAIGLRNSMEDRYGDVDDAYAIHRMLLEQARGKVNVIAIAVQYGNGDNVTEMYEVLKTLVNKTGVEPSPALIQGPSVAYKKGGPVSDSMKSLFKIVRENPKPVTVIASGPSTVVAYIMDNAPQNVGEIYLEMGQYGPEWGDTCGFKVCGKTVGDFNFKKDIGAVAHLIKKWPNKIHFTPFQTLLGLKIDQVDLSRFKASKVEIEEWLANRTTFWYDQWTKIYNCEDYIHIWCMVPLMVGTEIQDHICDFKKVTTKIESCGENANHIQQTALRLTDATAEETNYSMMCPYYRLKQRLFDDPDVALNYDVL